MDQFKNFAKAQLATGYDSDDTDIQVLAGTTIRFPSPPFNAVWWNATDYPDPADDPTVEIVRVTAIDEDTLTITRAQEGTAANDKNVAGKTYFLAAGLTAATANEIGNTLAGFNRAILPYNVSDLTLGDVQANGNGVTLDINDTAQVIDFAVNLTRVQGHLHCNDIASASGPVGTVINKLAIYNSTGTLIGYLPIYDSIT